MITKVWLCEAVPNNWREAVLLPLFKKGDKRICSNYWGISLIDVAAKVFGVILLKRFQYERDQHARPNQSGFRHGANVHVSDLAYAYDIVLLSSSYSDMQSLLEATPPQ